MFDTILIANRGEIACRIMATARRMGIRSIAVYSQADAGARHVSLADAAYAIGPAPARESYLRMDAVLEAAQAAGAQAIHPGYGFLSENAEFAQRCADAGIVFIGPPPSAIRAMGSKSAAKALMAQSGVPLVPGYHGEKQSEAVLGAAAAAIGYPVLLKASAGGGGKGMRVVEAAADFGAALERARGEAVASFGDGRMLVERYLRAPRHIEVQVFADTFGTTLSLFERDCSIQRRHQKVLEESPAPGMGVVQRAALGAAAIAAARAVDYVGAGTVEFITEGDAFYFMEMNTRLQVEHPVTEFVTGLDLVEWQLRVAAGEALPVTQDGLTLRGHAIEARICAEDPAQDFMPATGRITHWRMPPAEPFVRVDTGIRAGDVISPYYDSMIAKLIVWGEDRPTALRRLRRALAATELAGVRSNLDLLRAIAADADFGAGGVDTGFIGAHPALLEAMVVPPAAWAAAVLGALPGAACDDSPWSVADGWRLNASPGSRVVVGYGGETVGVDLAGLADGAWRLELPGGAVEARLERADADGTGRVSVGGVTRPVRLLNAPGGITVIMDGCTYGFVLPDPLAPPAATTGRESALTAPTPARVAAVFVQPGEAVVAGQALLVLEAMKVETTFRAPGEGVVETVHVTLGEMIAEGALLVSFQTGSND